MSVQGAPIVRSGNQFFDQLPNDTVISIFGCLKGENDSLALRGDDKAIIATAAVCRNWQDNVVLSNERQKSSTRLHQRIGLQNVHRQMAEREYPLEIRQLFQNCNTPIWRLPVLSIQPEQIAHENMSSPIMRLDNFPGIALHLQGRNIFPIMVYTDRHPLPRAMNPQGTNYVLIVFRRDECWEHLEIGPYGRAEWCGCPDLSISNVLYKAHQRNLFHCNFCSPNQDCRLKVWGLQTPETRLDFIRLILANEHPFFEIANREPSYLQRISSGFSRAICSVRNCLPI